jgi:4-diphosphocytidyl-2-C-methyl-D-erythritol kinase
MKVRTVAPAKINWTLEVLGERNDGYHEIKSVMQTIDLCDDVEVEKSDRTTVGAEGYDPDEHDLTLRAVKALEEAVGRELPVAIRLVKRIPVAAGLGGGSSDAAAVLRAVDRLYELGLSQEELAEVGARVGSDVPFFVYGGTALAEGRGDRVTPLGDVSETWLVLLVPPIILPEKTKTVYGALTEDEGWYGPSDELVKWLARGDHIRGKYLFNYLESAAYKSFPGLARYRLDFARAGAAENLAGAGPTFFALVASRVGGEELACELEGSDAEILVSRTLGAEEATRVVVE